MSHYKNTDADMVWYYRKLWRNGFWRKICNYSGVVVVFIIFTNIAMIHRNFDMLENENFIDAGGTDTVQAEVGRENTEVFHRNGAVYSNSKIRHIFENKLRRLLEIMETTLENTVSYKNSNNIVHMKTYFSDRLINCDDIVNVTDRVYLASGWTKAVYRGTYLGTPVALKTVDPKGQDVTTCMESGKSYTECYVKAAKKIVKEIVILQALADRNVLKVLGFCLPRNADDSLWVAMVTELGESVDLIKLLQMSWEDRLRVCLDITRIVNLLNTSPYGSMSMNDFRRQQFVLVDGTLKLSDVDDAGFEDPTCKDDEDCHIVFTSSNMTHRSRCIGSRCPYNNAKRNLYNAGRHFVTFLLPHGAPQLLQPIIDKVVDGYTNLSMSSRNLLKALEKIVYLYRTGWYMNRTKPEDSVTKYIKIPHADLPGMYDYRCRFSLSSAGCSVSVYDQREAEDVCDMDEECKGFVMSPTKTWTGRKLMHLKSGVKNSVYHPTTDLYVKPDPPG